MLVFYVVKFAQLLGNNAIPENVTNVYVPADSVDDYKAASVWSEFAIKISATTSDQTGYKKYSAL